MRKDGDKLVFESRREVDLMQNICDGFLALSKSMVEDEEKELAKLAAVLLEEMYLSW